jgi:hypothetical protein
MKISEATDHTKMTVGTLTIPTTAISGNGFSAQPTVTVNNPGDNTYAFHN